MSSSDGSGNRSRERNQEQAQDQDQNSGASAEQSGTSSEFGTFVSSSVRQSFRQLKRDAELARASGSSEPGSTTPSRRSRRTPTPAPGDETAATDDVPIRRGPVGRRWRDTAPGSESGSADTIDAESATPPRHLTLAADDGEQADSSSDRFDVGIWFRDTFLDEDGPNRRLWLTIAGIILAIVIMILLLQLGGDDGPGSDPTITPEPTTSNVINAERTPTTNVVATPPTERVPPTTGATETPEVQEGGDNQR